MSDRKLLKRLLAHLEKTGALSVPKSDLKEAVNITLKGR